ncbi:MAG: transglutaminase domain-containing protein [Akkermansiaceae bacterium]|nr:transglutaminase domain-containing protein [Akkermansiaceae bacterium]MCP5545479.1 transglutaminase domain-containing protein [Akkermansiaceae bacterium]MCP5545833.1 transglutaminase domain-containing protein [Akkermansiaceae bacterium]
MLGTTLLFWGAMTGRPLLGLMLALLVEARHWTALRWDFGEREFSRAWQLTTVAVLLATVLIWLDGNRYTALPNMLTWLPPLLVPMQFVQGYGLREAMPTSVFSFLARRRHERNLRLGLPEEITEFNFGNIYFVCVLIASTLGNNAYSWTFLPGMVILCGWMLVHRNQTRPWLLLPVLALAGAMALLGEKAIERAEEWIGTATVRGPSRFDPKITRTHIGWSGTVTQSPEIEWRLRLVRGKTVPRLLRKASYQQFLGTNWTNTRSTDEDFQDLQSRLVNETAYELLQPSELNTEFPKLPAFELRGSAFEESPLPLPGDAAAVSGFDLDGIERDPYGTVRVFPKHSVINGSVFWSGGTNPEEAPVLPDDLRLPNAEVRAGVLQEIVDDLRLEELPDLRSKLSALRAWFGREFRYSRRLTISRGNYETNKPTAIDQFLTEVRAGHCEYFATSAALILRTAGIPARYATGFAVAEKDTKRNEYIIRGTHGHAWCRVWDNANLQWVDFDATPPDWFGNATPRPTRAQIFNDWLQRLREDFFVWRNQPGNRIAVSLSMSLVGAALAAFVFFRLWRSRRRIESRSVVESYAGTIVRTPLHELEARAVKLLGHRAPGESFAHWLGRLRPLLPDDESLDEAIQLHQRMRFDPHPAPDDHLPRLRRLVNQLDGRIRRR